MTDDRSGSVALAGAALPTRMTVIAVLNERMDLLRKLKGRL